MLSAPVPSVPTSSRTGSASHLGRQCGGPPIWWMLFSISSFTRHVIDQSTLHLHFHLYFCLHYDHLSRQLVFHPHYARPNQRHQACHHPTTVEWTLTANKHIWKKKHVVLKIPENILSTFRWALQYYPCRVVHQSALLSVLEIFLGTMSTITRVRLNYLFT